MVFKGSFMIENKSPCSAQEERAEPSKAEQGGEAENEIKAETQQLLLDIIQIHSLLTGHS